MTKTYSFPVDSDMSLGKCHPVINGTEVLIIYSTVITSYAQFPILIFKHLWNYYWCDKKRERLISLFFRVFLRMWLKEKEVFSCWNKCLLYFEMCES